MVFVRKVSNMWVVWVTFHSFVYTKPGNRICFFFSVWFYANIYIDIAMFPQYTTKQEGYTLEVEKHLLLHFRGNIFYLKIIHFLYIIMVFCSVRDQIYQTI